VGRPALSIKSETVTLCVKIPKHWKKLLKIYGKPSSVARKCIKYGLKKLMKSSSNASE